MNKVSYSDFIDGYAGPQYLLVLCVGCRLGPLSKEHSQIQRGFSYARNPLKN